MTNNECKCEDCTSVKIKNYTCSIHGRIKPKVKPECPECHTPNPTEESTRELIRRETPDTRDLVKKVSSPTEEKVEIYDCSCGTKLWKGITESEDWRKTLNDNYEEIGIHDQGFGDYAIYFDKVEAFIAQVEQKAIEKERMRIYNKVNEFLSNKYSDVPQIHPFHEGIILDIILRPTDDTATKSLKANEDIEDDE